MPKFLLFKRTPVILDYLVAHLVKNPPAMWETLVQPLGWKIPWRRKRLLTPVFWSGEFHRLYIVHGVTNSWTQLSGFHFHFHLQSELEGMGKVSEPHWPSHLEIFLLPFSSRTRILIILFTSFFSFWNSILNLF